MTVKDAKINFIVGEAAALFLERPIRSVTIRDISERTGAGEATIYRYFSTKQNLVIAAAARLEHEIFDTYFRQDASGNGYEKLVLFYGRYLEIFRTRPELFRFINEFDAYMLGECLQENPYSAGLDMFKNVCSRAYEEGLADKSIRPVADWELFYYASTHAMLELCKKLSAGEIVKQDTAVSKEQEIAALAGIILYSLKNN